MSNYRTSSQAIYEKYCDTTNPVTKWSHLNTLKGRASRGEVMAKFLAAKVATSKP